MKVAIALFLFLLSYCCLCEYLPNPSYAAADQPISRNYLDSGLASVETSPFDTHGMRYRRDGSGAIDCMKLTNEISDESIFKDCKAAEVIDGNRDKIVLSKTPFDGFMEKTKEFNIPLWLQESDTKSLDLELLNKLKALIVDRNKYLRTVALKRLSKIENITITQNENLEDVDLSSVMELNEFILSSNSLSSVKLSDLFEVKNFTISGNSKLKEVNLEGLLTASLVHIKDNEELTAIDGSQLKRVQSLIVSDNAVLEKMKLNKLYKFSDGEIIVKNNPALKDMNVSALTNFYPLNVEITDNSALSKIELGNEWKELSYDAKALTIARNPSLWKIFVGKITEGSSLNNILIYGNRHLTRAQIGFQCSESSTNCYIQDDHECVFDHPIINLSELDGCQNIKGDLVLNVSISGSTTAKLSKIQKNLHIFNTSLNIEDLHFLENTNILGDFHVTTCGSRYIYSSITKNVKGKVSFSTREVCVGVCTASDLLIDKREDCATVNGDIQISESYSEEDVKNLKTIKRVNGRILLENAIPATESLGPLEFSNLETIETNDGGHSILLSSNKFLEKIPFPKLKSVENSACPENV